MAETSFPVHLLRGQEICSVEIKAEREDCRMDVPGNQGLLYEKIHFPKRQSSLSALISTEHISCLLYTSISSHVFSLWFNYLSANQLLFFGGNTKQDLYISFSLWNYRQSSRLWMNILRNMVHSNNKNMLLPKSMPKRLERHRKTDRALLFVETLQFFQKDFS